MNWELVGSVMVDSGTVAIGDPCYTQSKDASHVAETWSEHCDKTDLYSKAKEGTPQYGIAEVLGEQGIGLVFSTLYGDGDYPVYVERNGEGRVHRIMVDFDPGNEF